MSERYWAAVAIRTVTLSLVASWLITTGSAPDWGITLAARAELARATGNRTAPVVARAAEMNVRRRIEESPALDDARGGRLSSEATPQQTSGQYFSSNWKTKIGSVI